MIRVVEIMWLVIGAISAYEAVAMWNVDRQKSYLFLAFIGLAIFMFWFRRRSRLRFEERAKNNDNNS